MQPTYVTNINSPYAARYGTSFWTAGTNKLNGININFRDNILSRHLVYGMYISSQNVLLNQFNIKNCLFFDNYWYYWPTTGRYTYEHFGHLNARQRLQVPAFKPIFRRQSLYKPTPRCQKANVGYSNATDQMLISFTNCLNTDPFFTLSGAVPSDFYALKTGSPAIGTASDGTNIGAWQG
jgi:hypothetical protein